MENVSRLALERYQDLIREYVRHRNGVYALYRGNRLYYVGLARNLRTRLRAHLKNRHGESWDRFAVYLTIGDKHLKELESLLLRIVKPVGNRQSGKFARCEDLRKRLAKDIRLHQRQELSSLFGKPLGTKQTKRFKAVSGKEPSLARYNKGRGFRLRLRYKGKLYRGRIKRDGRVRVNGNIFRSPSMAAVSILKRSCNGWNIWEFERAPGDWVKLKELRK